MGRSRENLHSSVDPTKRSRKTKNAANVEKFESSSMVQDSEGGGGGKYNCDYCKKDITGKIRIKCAVCPDFDLCVECMCAGAEITPHKRHHAYRVMGNLTFPLICHDWSADDEMLLMEARDSLLSRSPLTDMKPKGLEIFGFGNWEEVAEHVGGAKSKEECLQHYRNIYLNSPSFPLPNMSYVAEKSQEELPTMAKGRVEDKKDSESHAERSFGGNNTLVELSNYNEKRQEFDPEYDNDAEQLLAEMEFNNNDTPEEKKLKLRLLSIFSKRIDERKRRKEFILERNLLYPNPFEKDLSQEEKAQCRRLDVLMRFHSKEDHEELLRSVVSEYRMVKRLRDIKEAQMAGCRSTAEAERYLGRKRKRESEEGMKEMGSRPHVQASISYVNDFDLIGFTESQLLSESEKRLCVEAKLVPPVYLEMQKVMTQEIFKGNVTKKSDAYSLFKIDPTKVDRVYDMLVKKGIAQL